MIVLRGRHARSTSRTSTALDGVSFVIDKGEFVFVVGASGSGKSTIIRLLLKELEPTRGRDHRRRPRPRRGSSARRCRCCAATSAASSRTSSCSRTAPPPRTSPTRCGCRASRPRSIRRKVPEVLNLVGLAHKMSSQARRALRRRAAARLDRARVRQPPAAPDLRRADRQPRPRHVGRDHAAPLPHQPHRHDDPDGHPRPRDGRQDAQARDRARRRASSCATSGAGGTRPNDPLQARLLRGASARSARTSRRSIAATMTVLIGMFLLGLFIALGTLGRLLVGPREARARGARSSSSTAATPKQVNAVGCYLESGRASQASSITFVSKAEALEAIMQQAVPAS